MKQFIEKRNAAIEELEALKNTIMTQTRAFSEEEQAKFDELTAEVRSIDATIENMKKVEEIAMSNANVVEERAVAEVTESQEEREIREFANMVRGHVENRAATNLTPATGAGAIPTKVVDMIIRHIYEISPILERCVKFDIKGNIKVPTYTESGDNAITVAFVEDGSSLTSQVGQVTAINLATYTAGALALVGKSLLAQSDLALTEFVVTRMAEAIARFMESAMIKGATVDATHSITGLSGVAAGMTVTTASSTAVTMGELIQCENKITSSLSAGAIWLMSRATFGAIKELKDSQNRYYMLPMGEQGTSAFKWTLLGHEVCVTDNIDAMEAGKKAIYLVNPKCVALHNPTGSYELQVLTERFADQHCYGVIGYTQFDCKILQQQGVSCITMKS